MYSKKCWKCCSPLAWCAFASLRNRSGLTLLVGLFFLSIPFMHKLWSRSPNNGCFWFHFLHLLCTNTVWDDGPHRVRTTYIDVKFMKYTHDMTRILRRFILSRSKERSAECYIVCYIRGHNERKINFSCIQRIMSILNAIHSACAKPFSRILMPSCFFYASVPNLRRKRQFNRSKQKWEIIWFACTKVIMKVSKGFVLLSSSIRT